MKGDKKQGFWIGKWQPILILASLLVATVIVVACSSGSTSTTSGMAAVKVTLSDPATCEAPNGPFSAVWVTISDVQANVNPTAPDTDSGWVDLTPGLTQNKQAVQVNMLALASSGATQCLLAHLGDNLELQAGNYQQIRLILASTTTGFTLTSANNASSSVFATTDQCSSTGAANCVQLASDSSFHALLLSSEAKTGLKIPPGQINGGGISISAGETKDLNIDFNTCASIVQEGNHQYRLKPVLTAGVVSTTSTSMNGKVVDATGAAVAGATVALEQPDGTKDSSGNPIDRIVAATLTASDGTWVICPLTQGNPSKPYDVVIIGGNASGMLSPTIVTGVSVGSTAGTVTLNAPASALTAAANTTATLSGQVTSVNTSSAGTPIDASLRVLETFSGMDYTIPLPATTTQISPVSIDFTTAANQTPACNPGSTDCYNYSITVPASSAYIGAWSSGAISLTAPTSALATYIVDGLATTTGSTTPGPDCTPSELFTTATSLTTTPLPPAATGLNLAFTSCQ